MGIYIQDNKTHTVMKAYKCDRCNCYFSDKKTVYSGAIRVEADFCPRCVRSFERWVRMEDGAESKLDGNPVDIDKAVEHYDGTLGVLKGIDLEEDG